MRNPHAVSHSPFWYLSTDYKPGFEIPEHINSWEERPEKHALRGLHKIPFPSVYRQFPKNTRENIKEYLLPEQCSSRSLTLSSDLPETKINAPLHSLAIRRWADVCKGAYLIII